MQRKLATIRRILSVDDIPNADLIELVTIDGWKVVCKKNEFKPNDLCIYFEIDSVLPNIEPFEFLKDLNFRIRTIKLRGQISQGIVFPLSILDYFNYSDEIKEHTDLTDVLNIKKYEPPIPANLSGKMAGTFTPFVPGTDAERIQNLCDDFESWKNSVPSIFWIVSEKLDGTPVTYEFRDDVFHVYSRNLEWKETDDNTQWKLAKKYDIENKLKFYTENNPCKNIAIQGEIIGEGIQKNKYNIKGQDVRFFCNAFNIDSQKYFTYEETKNIYNQLNLPIVPVLSEHMVLNDFTINSLLLYAEGKSSIGEKEREGIIFVSEINEKRMIFKVISNKFLLKKEK